MSHGKTFATVRHLCAASLICAALVWPACSDDSTGAPDQGGVEAGVDAGRDAAADGPARDALPPPICRKPPAAGSGPYFTKATAKFGLDKLSLGNAVRVSSADLDGDGYADVVLHKTGSNNRDDLTASPQVRYRFVLRNGKAGAGRAFADVTEASGYTAIRGGGRGRAAHLAVFGDVDNDGDLDVFSGANVDPSATANPADPGDRNELLLNDGKGNFTLAPKSGLFHDEKYATTSAAFLDYDRDGNLDLFVGYSYEIYGYLPSNQDRLYKGNGDGTFTDVTQKMGLLLSRDSGFANGTNAKPTWGVTACDVDGDGDDDLVTSSYGRQYNMLWRNDGAKFTEVGEAANVWGDSNVDYSDSEYYKCYCTAASTKDTPYCKGAKAPLMVCPTPVTGYWQKGTDDQPWRNNGNTFTTACGDLDNDGDLDLFNTEIHHWHIGGSSDSSQILRNTGKSPIRFERLAGAATGITRKKTSVSWNEGDISGALFDFDNDGDQDILLMDSDYPETHVWLFRQKADHTFENLYDAGNQAGLEQGCGQEVSVADYDRDGDLDVIMGYTTMRGSSTGCTAAQVNLYENQLGEKSNFLQVQLVGKGQGGANRAGIGAWVQVTAGGQTQLQELSGGYGHFGLQNDVVLHFGLGGSCTVDKLEVRWPDSKGSTTTLTGVQANYRVRIDQATGQLTYLTQ